MARRRETQRHFRAARPSYFALFEEDTAGPYLRKGQVCGCISALENMHLIKIIQLATDSATVSTAGPAGFFPLLTFAHRFRCASAIARRAFSLKIRRAGVLANFLTGLAWVPSVRMPRACFSFSISSSRAFKI